MDQEDTFDFIVYPVNIIEFLIATDKYYLKQKRGGIRMGRVCYQLSNLLNQKRTLPPLKNRIITIPNKPFIKYQLANWSFLEMFLAP